MRLSGILLAVAAAVMIAFDIIYVFRLNLISVAALATDVQAHMLESTVVLLVVTGVRLLVYWIRQGPDDEAPTPEEPWWLASFLRRHPVIAISFVQMGLAASLIVQITECFEILRPLAWTTLLVSAALGFCAFLGSDVKSNRVWQDWNSRARPLPRAVNRFAVLLRWAAAVLCLLLLLGGAAKNRMVPLDTASVVIAMFFAEQVLFFTYGYTRSWKKPQLRS